MPLKMVLVVRNDLGMRKGKMCAQAAHAAHEAILDRSDPDRPKLKDDELVRLWLTDEHTKITVRVNSEAELLALCESAAELGINYALIEDLGHTEFHGVKTLTCAAFGPAPAEVLQPLTGSLQLL